MPLVSETMELSQAVHDRKQVHDLITVGLSPSPKPGEHAQTNGTPNSLHQSPGVVATVTARSPTIKSTTDDKAEQSFDDIAAAPPQSVDKSEHGEDNPVFADPEPEVCVE